MHHRQNILDAALTALQGLATLTGGATSSRFFDEAETDSARVVVVNELLPEQEQVPEEDTRTLTIRVLIMIAGHDVQRTMNAISEEIEAQLTPALEAQSDCVRLLSITPSDIQTDSDREAILVAIDYAVDYSTAVGDPSMRV